MKLKKPIVFDGKDISELNIDFDSMTGQDLIDAATEARARGDKSPIIELSKTYQAVVVAKAAKVSSDLIVALGAKDFSVATNSAQAFLLE